MKDKIHQHIKSTLLSYSQIFFSENLLFATLLLLITFVDKWAGFCGLLAVLITNIAARGLGYNKVSIEKGLLGFNSLLTGLGLGLYYQPGVELFVLTIVAALIALLFSIVLTGVLGKYYLPYLSIPFLFSTWIIIMANSSFTSLGLSERGIFLENEVYALGGQGLWQMYDWFNKLVIPVWVRSYFLSLGAIFFQYNLLSGILVALGLLVYSRIAFSLSVLGFGVAYLFYQFIGADFSSLSYTYVGFNYILSSMAIGGFFFIPGWASYLSVVALLPIVVLVTISSERFFFNLGLPIYSVPFNLVVIMFLYAMKMRMYPGAQLKETLYQHSQPESNLYFSLNEASRFKNHMFFPITLPFWGEWKVSQSHNGPHTHQGDWRHAWDFVIADEKGEQYKDAGDFPEDYFCYGKNIISPGAGYIEEVVDTIDDNKIGTANLQENWGNSIVIKHADYLYSQVSHLKKGSIKVKKGDFVTQGQVIGQVGNSGRSPYPHLHFQVQSTPYIGSKTIDYPLYNYLLNKQNVYRAHSFEKPVEGDIVSNPPVEKLLENAFELIPGRSLKFKIESEGEERTEEWEVHIDPLNNSYIYCRASNSYAYFFSNSSVLYFTDFVGDKHSFLFLFSLIFNKVQLGFYRGLHLIDSVPLNYLHHGIRLLVQDFIAPFYRFLKSDFRLDYLSVDDEFSPSEIKLNSSIHNKIFAHTVKLLNAEISITSKGIARMEIVFKQTKITASCIE